MNFTGKLTFKNVLIMPFRLALGQSILVIMHKIVSIALAPLGIYFTANFINKALMIFNNGTIANDIFLPLLGLAAIRAYSSIFDPLIALISKKRDIKLRQILRIPFVEKRVKLEYRHVEDQSVWDVVSRTWDKPEEKLFEIFSSVVDLMQVTLTSASYIVILLSNTPMAGSAIIIVSVFVIWLSFKGGQASYDAELKTSVKKRKYMNLSTVLTSREAVNERNMFGYVKKLNEIYYNEYESARKYEFRVRAKWFVRSKSLSLAVSGISIFAIFALLPSAINGNITVGLFISLSGALFSVINWMSWSIPSSFQSIAHSNEYIKDLNKFFTLSEQKGAIDLPAEKTFNFQSLEFRNVSFTYPGTDKKILDGFSFIIKAKKHYSFVGSNGAGKTTVTKLITRLYDNYDGEILLNNRDIRSYELRDIKACFAAVFQDFVKYDITLAENIALGKANGSTEEEIENAIAKAGLKNRVMQLSDGKNTMLGKSRDNGIDLSGGEWQRLAIARAIISTSPVKILDEPTAALDPVAESELYKQFEEISRGLTTIFISHRLGSATLSDEIFVINNGKVVEQGSHKQLMEQNGIYTEMFNNQRSWYI